MRNAILFSVCLLCSCTHYSPDIEAVLKQAGSNRGELEKVLKHYSRNPADSLKLRAAEFLIVNMPGKYSAYYDAPWNDVATVRLRWTSSSDKQLVVDTYKLGNPIRKDDVTHITAEYLINNIELAFKVWQEQLWGKYIPFDIFCEEILPYRLNTEPLENWREKALASFNDLNLSFKKDSIISPVKACIQVNSKLPRIRIDKDFPPMNFSQLMASTRGDCGEMAALAVFSMRALGIPVTVDYTPFWPDRKNGHTWNSVCDTSGVHVSFMGAETNPGNPHQATKNPFSKALRRTFAKQNDLDAEELNFPPALRDAYSKDVTTEYASCSDVKIPLAKNFLTEAKYVFLSTPYEMEWNNVAWGVIEHDSLRFSSVGKKVLYLPVYYQDEKVTAADYPFWLDKNGHCRFFKPDTIQSFSITRIAPPDNFFLYRMINGRFEGANKEDFSDAKLLYTVKKIDGPWYHTSDVKNRSKYRYVRYVSPPRAKCNVAEIRFFGQTGEKLRGKIIGTTGSWENSSSTRDKVFDGDPTTFFDAANEDSWVGLDLGEPQTITKVRYLSRNDGYSIYEDHVYELFYWNGKNWQSLVKKTAEDHIIQYDAPANALYIIKNTTNGKIYRLPFIVENGEQKWFPL